MIGNHTVLVVLLAEVALAVLAAALLVAHGLLATARRRQLAARTAAARAAVAHAIEDAAGVPEASAALRALPAARQIAVVADIARSLSGEGRARVQQISQAAGIVARAQRLARSRRWRSRLRGARLFSVLSGGEDVMVGLLDDSHDEVVAQAVEWAGEHPRPEVVERLLELLVSGHPLSRYAVASALPRLGAAAVEPFTATLGAAEGERAAVLLRAALPVAAPGMLPAAQRLIADPSPAARAGAAALLASLGGKRAVAALTELLADPDPVARVEALRGLGRIGAWEAAGAAVRSLEDPVWDVRRAAALALVGMGPAGVLLLRQSLESDDPFARDMARQVLDLPGLDQGFVR